MIILPPFCAAILFRPSGDLLLGVLGKPRPRHLSSRDEEEDAQLGLGDAVRDGQLRQQLGEPVAGQAVSGAPGHVVDSPRVGRVLEVDSLEPAASAGVGGLCDPLPQLLTEDREDVSVLGFAARGGGGRYWPGPAPTTGGRIRCHKTSLLLRRSETIQKINVCLSFGLFDTPEGPSDPSLVRTAREKYTVREVFSPSSAESTRLLEFDCRDGDTLV
ncbi:hypothetical protein [Streptomyces sp. Sge12]|uniref:hypothetical protein n=1 Tax=Streptomyces sp. Sge12 TaxID=1972846 RepID=UPI0013317D91|nr:hypothetical protein [Streptomyces sp. Sge12]